MARAKVVDGLTPVQEKAIVALLTEQTMTKAAESVGVSTTAIHKWLKQHDFLKAYRQARREAFGQSIALCQRYSPLAVNTLAKILMDEKVSANAKVSAATAILKFGREGIELEDLAARVDALEEAAEIEKGRTCA